MTKAANKLVVLGKDYKARIPSEEEMIRKLSSVGIIKSSPSGRGKNAQQSQMLAEFVRLLASRPSGTRHINRLVVDWTRVVEARNGIGSEMPMRYADKPLFHFVMDTLFPPEVADSAKAVYDALFAE